jgi:flotillin
MEDPIVIVGVMAGVLVISLGVLVAVVKRLMYVVPPNQILVLSGRPNRLPDGRVVGYRIVTGGRVLRMPILERADLLDIGATTVAFELPKAYARDGVPLALAGTARFVVLRTTEDLANYVERFLGRRREEMQTTARETLEGHVRSVVSRRSADELGADLGKAADEICTDANPDLTKLGLAAEVVILREFTAPPPPARVPD